MRGLVVVLNFAVWLSRSMNRPLESSAPKHNLPFVFFAGSLVVMVIRSMIQALGSACSISRLGSSWKSMCSGV